MKRALPCLAVVALVLLARPVTAEPPAVVAAVGKVEKVSKDTLSLQPRGPDGKFQKAIALKITGTSQLSTVSLRDMGGKPVVVQKDAAFKDLEPGQFVGVLYTTVKGGNVLLSAAVQPDAK
jgi:hypothetical protein